MPLPDDLRTRLVIPYYKDLLGNAVANNDHAWKLLSRFLETHRLATDAEVRALLSDTAWQSQAVGAWLAVGRTDSVTEQALLRCLAQSQGWLTAAPLAVASVLVAGTMAVPALIQHMSAAVSNHYGSGADAAVALEHLGFQPFLSKPDDGNRERFAELLAYGRAIESRNPNRT